MNLREKLNIPEDWYRVLKDVFESQEFLEVGKKIALDRIAKDVFPYPEEVFAAFRYTPYSEFKILWLSMDPYNTRFNQEPVACGLAFTPRHELNIPPSLRVMGKELESDIYTPLCLPCHGLGRDDLISWAKQGVLLLNAALTVREKEPGSHLSLWEPITRKILRKLSEANPGLVVILLGNDAQKFEDCFINSNIIKAGHPASETYGKGKFYGSKIFSKTNEIIRNQNGQEFEIRWLSD